MEKQIHSAFDEVKAGQQLKTDTKYFLYEFYRKQEVTPVKPLKRLILVPLCAVLVFAFSLGIFTTAVPVTAVSLDVESTSVELELNSLNKVVKATCFGEGNCFSGIEFNSLSCEEAVSLIIEKAKSENADISRASLTVNCKNRERAQKIADTLSDGASSEIEISCHSSDGKLQQEAHSHGVSTGKYRAYIVLKEYEPDLTVEEIRHLSVSELRERIASHSYNGKAEPNTPTVQSDCRSNHDESSHTSGGKHHGKNK